jgi:uncharacterized protein DUF3883
MIRLKSQYYAWIESEGVGSNDLVASSPGSYVSYLNRVSELIGKDISPELLSTEEDVERIARSLEGRKAPKTITNYKSAMRQYVAMIHTGVSTMIPLIPVLNTRNFLEQFEVFKAAVLADSGKEFESFNTGLPYEWEQYKEVVYHEARQQLNYENWKKSDIGTGSILQSLINAIEIKFPKGKRKYAIENNLVDWDSRFGPNSRTHLSLFTALETAEGCTSYETLLFDFYRDELSPPEVFARIITRAGKRYDFIAYVFFLKDWSQFLPIAPTNFDRAFELLKVNLRTARRCSWQNYQEYLGVLRQVRDALREAGVDDARLIDAHSFCWMLQHPGLPKLPIARTVPLPVAFAISAAMPVSESIEAASVDAVGKTNWKLVRDNQAALGRLAEDTVLEAERSRLRQAGRSDLAERVHSVSDDHRKGYDIESFDEDETPRLNEVKAARRDKGVMTFFLTENEWQKSRKLANYFFYLVFDARASSASIRYFPASQLNPEALNPIVHTARIVES